MAEPIDIINENLEGPKKGQNNMGLFEQHSLTDQIEAAKFTASETAKTGRNKGVIFNTFKMPSSQ